MQHRIQGVLVAKLEYVDVGKSRELLSGASIVTPARVHGLELLIDI